MSGFRGPGQSPFHDPWFDWEFLAEEAHRYQQLPRPEPLDVHWARLMLHVGAGLPGWRQRASLLPEFSRPLASRDRFSLLTVRFPREGVTVFAGGFSQPTTVRCSCGDPECVHAAVALEAVLSGAYDKDWHPRLQQVAASMDSRTAEPTEVVALGLVLVVALPTRWGTPAGLWIRPGLRTRKGTWNRQVLWSDLLTGHRGKRFDPAQTGVVASLLHQLPPEPSLDTEHLGAGLWDLLRAAREAGIDLGVEDQDGNQLSCDLRFEGPLRLTTVVRGETSLRLEVEMHAPLEKAPPPERTFLGRPPHTALSWEGELLVLTPVQADALAAMVLAEGGLEVPETEVERFTREFRPLAEQSTVRLETDDAPLRAVAIFRGRGVEGADVSWQWDRAGLRTPMSAGGPEDPAEGLSEGALRRQLLADHPELADWLGRDTELGPVESCLFGLEIAPVLREDPDLDLEIIGEALDYQPAGETDIVWEVADSDRRDWFDLTVELSVDGTPVPMAALIRGLAGGDELLVLPDGRYVDLTTEPMRRLRELLDDAAALEVSSSVQVPRRRFDVWQQLQELGELRRGAPGWRSRVEALADAEVQTLLPTGVTAVLRDYQLEGFRWLTARWRTGAGGLLADDMGLGKTLQVLSVISTEHREGDAPVLITAPRSVLRTWADQAAEFTPDLTVRVVRSGAELAAALASGPDVVVTSHQIVRRGAEAFAAQRWSALVVDEAQAVKNPGTALHRALRQLPREVTFTLTGTPVENSVVDLWSLLELAAPGALPEFKQFLEEFRRPIESGDQAQLDRLRRRVDPFLLRRTKHQVATELPPKIEQVVSIDLGSDHAARYRRLRDRERQVVLGLLAEEGNNQVAILASLTRLRMCAAELGEPGRPSEKSAFLLSELASLSQEGHRALVFSQFPSHLRVFAEQAENAGISTEYLDGSTTSRDEVIDRFRTGTADAFLISLKAGGVGITLTEADYVFLLDPWWNPAVESQAIDRAHRIGQQRPVNVYRLVSATTIEEKVMALQESKRKIAEQLLSGSGSAVLDPDEIRGLLEGP